MVLNSEIGIVKAETHAMDTCTPPRKARRLARSAGVVCAAGVLVVAALCDGGGAYAQGAAARNAQSNASSRKDVAITVYNQNFGLVREVRELELGTGRVALEFHDVASTIQPQTVAIKPLGGGLRVLEQNYRYDLLTPQTLLEKYVGKALKIYRYDEKAGKDQVFDAQLLSVAGGQPVISMNGEITYGFPGRFAFPGVPDNLIAKPTLVWLLESTQPKQQVEVTYLAQSRTWQADYVLVVDDKDSAGDLTGWVTLNNGSGASYENARLKLVAGDVQRVAPEQAPYAMPSGSPAPEAPAPPQFRQESFFEYHLYTLERPATLLQNEQKQITLLEAKGAKVQKKMIFYGQQYWYRGQYGEPMSNQKVGVYLDIQNSQANNLGIPLPKGVVRVYKADSSGAKQFIGEDQIDHTPRDEKIRVKMGEAFDVVGERKQMSWTALGTCVSESSWEISLRNHKDTAETVEDVEPVGGDWQVLDSSLPYVKKDAFTFTFEAKVPARGETKIKYRVRVRWC